MNIVTALLLLAMLGIISLILFLIMIWARNWPKVRIGIEDESIENFTHNGKNFYLPAVSYTYEYDGVIFNSSSLSLFGSKRFSSRKKAEELLEFDSAFVCPVLPQFSYVYQSATLRTGFIILFFASISISGITLCI